MVTIYTLSYISNDTPFYVGATKLPLSRRFSSHGNLLKENGINKKDVYISSIDTCNPIDAQKSEVFWIAQLKYFGFTLINKMVDFSSYPIPKIKKKPKQRDCIIIDGEKKDRATELLRSVQRKVSYKNRKETAKELNINTTTLNSYLYKLQTRNEDLALKIFDLLNKKAKKSQRELDRLFLKSNLTNPNNMISGQRLDAVNIKLAAIKKEVKVKDVDKLCSRNEFDKYKVLV